MTNLPRLKLFTVLAACVLACAVPIYSQEQKDDSAQKYQKLARRVVITSAGVKPGEVVVIAGGAHTIPLMEALAIETAKAGGFVTMFLSTDRVIRAFNTEVPEQYLELQPRYFAEWLKHIDVWIDLPGEADSKAVAAGVSESRFAKIAKSGQIIGEMLNESKVRLLSIGFPTKEQAANIQVDFPTYEKMHWDAVNADYKSISEKGAELKKLLQGAKKIRITSPSSTDLSFTVADRPIYIDDGIVTPEEAQTKVFINRAAALPGGRVQFAPVETSANGKIVVPRMKCRYAPLTDIAFEFKNGKMQGFKAGKGAECFKEVMAPYAESKDILGSITIGLNPAFKSIESADYYPYNAAGMVWISTGENAMLGGTNKEPGGFFFPIVNATVRIDDKVIVKDGRLAQ